MLNIAIANDTAIAVEALRRTLADLPDYNLLWVARTGVEAVERATAEPPDLILMDINMPELGGVGATRQIMQVAPCAILIVTASVTLNTAKVFEAMSYGALDVVKTPSWGSGDPEEAQVLLRKIATVSKLVRRQPQQQTVQTQPSPPQLHDSTFDLPNLVAIGASTGGPNTLKAILSQLPGDFQAAIVVIQHIDCQFAASLVDWLNRFSTLPVSLACNGDRPQAGRVLVAGTNDHLILRPNRTLRYTREPAESFYRPSVDVFFQSLARHWGQRGTAVLLTGMGRDGAMGMSLLHEAKWQTIAENEASCVVFGMPKAAIAAGAVREVLSVDAIVDRLAKRTVV